MTTRPDGVRLSAGSILGGALLFACLLAGPGTTVTASYVNDLFIFLDGAQRIASGQVPSRDFHTALGPLSFYIPALGYWASGTMGGAMPYGMAFVTLALALPIAHVIGSRLQPVLAIPYGLFLVLVLAMPTNLGESVTALSFAMFYNRIGWAALSALLIMYLPPARAGQRQNLLDAACSAALILAMLYTKITYGAVALAFLGFLLLDQRQRRWVLISIGLILTVCLLAEAFWRSTPAYFQDLALAGLVSGSRSPMDIVMTFLRHLADVTMLAILVVPLLWRTRSLRDCLFFAFCILPGVMIQSQNAQPWGVLTLQAGAAVAAQMLLRSETRIAIPEERLASFRQGAPLLLFALVVPTLLQCLMALGFHTALALSRSGQAFDLPRFREIRLIAPWLSDEKTLMHAYLASIENGARALAALSQNPAKVSVLDFSNPFSAGLDLPPPNGDSAWLHWGRNINDAHFIPPDRLLADVEVLMLPDWGINTVPLKALYGDYIDTAFEPLEKAEGWTLYGRRNQDIAAGPRPQRNRIPDVWLNSGDRP